MRNNRTETGKVNGRAWAIPREHVVRAALMSGFPMGHRPANGDFVGNFSGMFEVFAEMNPWNLGLDALERSAVLEWGIGFGIP